MYTYAAKLHRQPAAECVMGRGRTSQPGGGRKDQKALDKSTVTTSSGCTAVVVLSEHTELVSEQRKLATPGSSPLQRRVNSLQTNLHTACSLLSPLHAGKRFAHS